MYSKFPSIQRGGFEKVPLKTALKQQFEEITGTVKRQVCLKSLFPKLTNWPSDHGVQGVETHLSLFPRERPCVLLSFIVFTMQDMGIVLTRPFLMWTDRLHEWVSLRPQRSPSVTELSKQPCWGFRGNEGCGKLKVYTGSEIPLRVHAFLSLLNHCRGYGTTYCFHTNYQQ